MSREPCNNSHLESLDFSLADSVKVSIYKIVCNFQLLFNAPSLIVHHFYVSSPHPPFYYYMYALFPWNDVHTTSSAFENICTCTVGFLTQNTYFHSHCDQFMHWQRKYVKCKSWAISLFLNFVWNIFLKHTFGDSHSLTMLDWSQWVFQCFWQNLLIVICTTTFAHWDKKHHITSTVSILLSTFSFQFLCKQVQLGKGKVPFFNAD